MKLSVFFKKIDRRLRPAHYRKIEEEKRLKLIQDEVFTEIAKREYERNGVEGLILVCGWRLAMLWIDYYSGWRRM